MDNFSLQSRTCQCVTRTELRSLKDGCAVWVSGMLAAAEMCGFVLPPAVYVRVFRQQ